MNIKEAVKKKYPELFEKRDTAEFAKDALGHGSNKRGQGIEPYRWVNDPNDRKIGIMGKANMHHGIYSVKDNGDGTYTPMYLNHFRPGPSVAISDPMDSVDEAKSVASDHHATKYL